jgi:hypothetical protein
MVVATIVLNLCILIGRCQQWKPANIRHVNHCLMSVDFVLFLFRCKLSAVSVVMALGKNIVHLISMTNNK